MKKRILDLILCPNCKGDFRLEVLYQEKGCVKEGLLTCSCGEIYPVVNFIPRIFNRALNEYPNFVERYNSLLKTRQVSSREKIALSHSAPLMKTKRSFGYQWTRRIFSQIIPQFESDFLNYIHPVDRGFFKGKIGADMGCGFGRHLYYAAKLGAEMIGVDFSKAIDSAYKNTKALPNVHLIQADIYNLPLRNNIFDFAYSIGVLHHLPYPEKAFRALLPFIKQKGFLSIWVYSKSRPITNFIIESVRFITKKIPHKILYLICLFISVIEWLLVISPYKLLLKLPLIGRIVERTIFPRIKVYSSYPFAVIAADWFDRLSAPIRYYYSEKDLREWLSRAKLKVVSISPTGKYGWRAYAKL